MNFVISMKIKCLLVIEDKNIDKLVKSVNPENNPIESKSNQNISFVLEETKITYSFEQFEKITTLRLTLEDLLTHLSFAKEITNKVKGKE